MSCRRRGRHAGASEAARTVNSSSLSWRWMASILRTVPDCERMTSDWVVAPKSWNRTPRKKSPSVMPVAAKKQLSLATRSSVVSTRVEVVAEGLGGAPLLVVARVQDALDLAAEALEGGGGDDALGRAADAEEDVGAGVGQPVAIAPATSPSVMDRTRAPASRTSAIRSSWRGRSRITTPSSWTGFFRRSESACRLSVGRRR